MISHRLNDFRRLIQLRRNFCTKDYGERLTDFPNKYASGNASDWYNIWETNKYFESKDGSKEAFKMILPPPNVTGVLHLGHALTCTVQDVLARWYRMKNVPVLWVPGLDHAGIATQAVVEKSLHKTKGINRSDLTKEELMACIQQWKQEKRDEIKSQLKALGASLDWSREFFTMSKEHNKAATEAFVILSQRDLLYRSKDLINWSPTLKSAISDMEVEYVQVTGKTELQVPGYSRKVPFGQIADVAFKVENSEEHIVISTTRVETMLGDVAIAVHPEDPRYSQYIGRRVWHPFKQDYIPIIQDLIAKMDFGTGAVKITPAHDHADLAVAKQHNLDIIDVIGDDGRIIIDVEPYKGLPRFIARYEMLKYLKREGALKDLRNHEMLIPVCARSGDIVEYLIREQWFVRTKRMADRAVEAVRNGSLKIDPPEWTDLWFDWLGSNRDWNVSRQIWWGHRIPAYHYDDGTESGRWIVARSEEEARQHLQNEVEGEKDIKLKQDSDVLDTWFSSALLPLSAFGWPDSKFAEYYPLSLMETGHDIIFLWVARMVMLGMELTNTLPFKEVLLHGVLCDGQGKKMSKSRGNIIKPEHVINGITLEDLNAEAQNSYESGILSMDELKRTLQVNSAMFPNGIPDCGVDALRLTLCGHNIKNTRISFNVTECQTNKFFCNKIWQATKYILRMTDDKPVERPKQLSDVDRWILSRLSFMVASVNDAFAERHFYRAISTFRQFFHYEFCDFFLEATKQGFKTENPDIIHSHRYSLIKCLETSLRVIAPIMPYISDDLYMRCASKLPGSFLSLPSLMEAPYPTFSGELETFRDLKVEEQFVRILNVTEAIRNVLGQINRQSNFQVHVVAERADDRELFVGNKSFITAITRIRNLEIILAADYETKEGSLLSSVAGLQSRVYLILNKNDLELARDIIEKRKQRTQKKLDNLLKIKGTKGVIKPENEILREQEKIQFLLQELDHYPTFT